MFIDASAIVAILSREPGHDELARRLDAAAQPISSPLAVHEAAAAMMRKQEFSAGQATDLVKRFLERLGAEVVAIGSDDSDAALQAFERYGKRSGHPARLNMGDCFAYAMARRHRVPILYKGDDFALTDLA